MPDRFQRALRLLGRLKNGTFSEDRLDATTFTCLGEQRLGTRYRHLWWLAATGHEVEVTLRDGPHFGCTVYLSPSQPPESAVTGWVGTADAQPVNFHDAASFDIGRANHAAQAVNDGEWYLLLSLCKKMDYEFKVTLRNDPATTGNHWCRTASALNHAHTSDGWFTFVGQLFRSAPAALPTGVVGPNRYRVVNRLVRLRVEDAGTECLAAPQLIVFGPQAKCPTALDPKWAEDLRTGHKYAEQWLVDNRSTLPLPPAVIPASEPAPGPRLAEFAAWLRRLAQALTWVWLATDMQIGRERPPLPGDTGHDDTGYDEGITNDDLDPDDDARAVPLPIEPEWQIAWIRFAGRQFYAVKTERRPGAGEHQEPIPGTFDDDEDAAQDARHLWRFAVTTPERLRRHTVLGGISREIRSADDLRTRAAAVEDRANRLLTLAEHDRLGEAIETLRAVQADGLATARSIGDSTRTAARSAFERVFLQLVAGAGIIIAQLSGAFAPEIALGLLLVVSALIAGVALVALRYELPLAESMHRSFLDDLQIHASDLPEDDLERIVKMQALASARHALRSSKRAVRYVVTAGGLACLVGIVWMATAWQGPLGLAVAGAGALAVAAAWTGYVLRAR